jgi:hypothetical protein
MMHTANHATVVGVFHDAERAREAVRALRDAGFREEQIGVVCRHESRNESAQDTAAVVAGGAFAGAGAGASWAALWSLGVSFGVLPVLGPVLAAGTFAAALLSAAGGAAAGAVAGGLVGALAELGFSEHEARYYENEVYAGRTLVTVRADGRGEGARAILQRCGGYEQPVNEVSALATAGSFPG